VRYPFGHGISYTDFAYSDITVSGNDVTFTITNTGKVDGKEVAQVYVSCKNGNVYRPKKELRGFIKVALSAGESKTVTVTLDDKAFRYYNTEKNCWEIEDADYEIIVAASATDVRLSETVHIDGVKVEKKSYACYYNADIANVSDEDFAELLGREIPNGKWGGELTENDAICQLYYAKSGLGRLLYKILTNMKNKSEAKGTPDLNIMFIYNMPFRAMAKLVGGMISRKMVEDMVFLVNGHFFRGMGRLIRDFFRNLKANKKFKAHLEKLENGSN
jgi:beta-glucosidase